MSFPMTVSLPILLLLANIGFLRCIRNSLHISTSSNNSCRLLYTNSPRPTKSHLPISMAVNSTKQTLQ
jgi:hypothetical protein